MGTVWAVIVAAGDGRRFGRQKQFEPLGGRLVVEWSVTAARSCADGVVLVVPADRVGDRSVHAGADHVVVGAASRSGSVRAGLGAVPAEAEVILVHDAARPLASPALFAAVIGAVRAGSSGAVPGLVLTDTIKRVREGRVLETLDRSELVAVQTPQAFSAPVLRRAHAGGPEATDDAALLEQLGHLVVVVPGEATNHKLTELGDLELFEQLVGERVGAVSERRVGLGFDVHPFVEVALPGRELVLGGVHFPGELALVGHSDADVVAHSVADAMLGAASLGDLGEHFPDSDERWRGADSLAILRACAELVNAEGYALVNADCTVVCERPKLAAVRAEMIARLSAAAGAPVHVKATRPEGLGSLGRVEGIACLAVVLLER